MICIKCGETREIEFYSHYIRRSDYRCKECIRRYNREWVASHPATMIKVNKKRNNKRAKNVYHNKYAKTTRGRFHGLKSNAQVRGRNFEIEPNEFIEWFENTPNTCYYCDTQLKNGDTPKGALNYLTIDRKNNLEGYTKDNIAKCCRRCNIMKGEWFNEKQTIEIARKYFVL